jgi:predicted SAM-dependent methyltransferase
MTLTSVSTPSSRPTPTTAPPGSGGEPVWEAPTGARAVVGAGRAASSSMLIASGRTLTRVLRPRGEARLRAAIAAETGPVKISFGAGTVDLPGWLDTDFTWRAALCLDVTRPWPVPSGCVDYVYADQVIEHFPLDVGRAVLRHAHDALRPGGSIRLATPDVERTARMYLEQRELCDTHLDRHRSRGYPAEHPVDLLRVTFSENGHRFCYDFESLAAELQRAGFVDVCRHEAGESDEPAFKGLESRVDPTEVATTLTVEARRPDPSNPEVGA